MRSHAPVIREEGPLPQRLIHGMISFYLPAEGVPAWAAPILGAGAVIGAVAGALPASLAVLLMMMGLDFLTGAYAAWRRDAFTFRAAGDGFLRKAIITLTVVAVYVSGRLLGAGDYPGHVFASGFSLLNAGSVVRNYRKARMELPPFVEPVLVRLAQVVGADVERWLPRAKEKDKE